MPLRLKTIQALCICCLLFLAACGPSAPAVEPTSTPAPAERPTYTPRPTRTPRPTMTPAATGAAADGTTAAVPARDGTAAAETTVEGTPAGAQATKPPAANPPASGRGPEKYEYLGQSVPDQTQFLPNRPVTITWTIRNTGTVGWTKDYVLRYFSGPKAARDTYAFSKDVPVKDTINLTVNFTTPAALGNYDLWFKLTNSSGQNFGDLDLVFTVSNNPVKVKPSPTPAK